MSVQVRDNSNKYKIKVHNPEILTMFFEGTKKTLILKNKYGE